MRTRTLSLVVGIFCSAVLPLHALADHQKADHQKADHQKVDQKNADQAHGHGPLVHRFEHAEDWVKKFEGPERDAWQKPQEVVALLGDVKGKTVADLGAGTGYFLPFLSRAVGESGKVIAVDIEPDMVRYMKERAARQGLKNVEVRKGEGADPGLQAGSAFRVLIVDVWHHIPERGAYAKKLLSALLPGGAVYIVDFTMESKEGPPKAHRLKPEQVLAELKEGGLDAEIVKTPLTEQYVVVGRRPAGARSASP
jgi:SAM-dependent methyltransferase